MWYVYCSHRLFYLALFAKIVVISIQAIIFLCSVMQCVLEDEGNCSEPPQQNWTNGVSARPFSVGVYAVPRIWNQDRYWANHEREVKKMHELFSYNWQVREEWFEWCGKIHQSELTKVRTGGMGSILNNLFHVADCEQIWMNRLQGKPVIEKDIHTMSTLNEVIAFSEMTREHTEGFLSLWTPAYEKKELNIMTRSGKTYIFPYKKVMQHVITHEIHHIGQVSVWAREVGEKPVSSDLIFK